MSYCTNTLKIRLPILSFEVMQSVFEIFADLGGAEFTVSIGIYLIQCDIEHDSSSGDLTLIVPISHDPGHVARLGSVKIKIIESGYLLSAFDVGKNLVESKTANKSNLRDVFEQISGISTQIYSKSWN